MGRKKRREEGREKGRREGKKEEGRKEGKRKGKGGGREGKGKSLIWDYRVCSFGDLSPWLVGPICF
jgi:hypothetical protein